MDTEAFEDRREMTYVETLRSGMKSRKIFDGKLLSARTLVGDTIFPEQSTITGAFRGMRIANEFMRN